MDVIHVRSRAASDDILDTFIAFYCGILLFLVQLFYQLIPFGVRSYGASLLDSSPNLRVRSTPPRKQVRYQRAGCDRVRAIFTACNPGLGRSLPAGRYSRSQRVSSGLSRQQLPRIL